MIDKTSLRQSLKQRRREQAPTDIAHASLQACKNIQSVPRFEKAKNVAIYSPFAGEIDPLSLLALNKSFFLPVVEDNFAMRFIAVHGNEDMALNRYGILEPIGNEVIDVAALDAVVIPLVAFSRRGDRLGMGAGYYDRALAQCSETTFRVGFAYSWQEVEQLYSEDWDIPLHAVITEKDIIHCC